MIDKLVGKIKKLFGADKEKVIDKGDLTEDFMQRIDKVVKEKGIDRRGFFKQKVMYKDALNKVLERDGESSARELGEWIIDYINKSGDTPVRQQVKDKAGLS